MPLKCLNNSDTIYSFNYADADWEALRVTNKTSKCLKTSCCGAEVTLRTSHLGTKYFAHARKGPCSTAPMSAEHLLAQLQIVEGIQAADGWQFELEAGPEKSEITPTGREWRADVLATKGRAKIAFEVQWSNQTAKETERRQERYRASGVRGLWFFKEKNIMSTKELPVFKIEFNRETRAFGVDLDLSHYVDNKYTDPIHVSLPEFVKGCLTGKLVYAPAIGHTFPMEIFTQSKQCKRCLRGTNIVSGFKIKVSDLFPCAKDIGFNIYVPGLEPYITEWLPASTLRELKAGKLKVRKSFMGIEDERSYFSNGCFHCDGIQPRYYEYNSLEVEHMVAQVQVELTQDLAHMVRWSVNYWWFNQA